MFNVSSPNSAPVISFTFIVVQTVTFAMFILYANTCCYRPTTAITVLARLLHSLRQHLPQGGVVQRLDVQR
jgi:hypothetical protein